MSSNLVFGPRIPLADLFTVRPDLTPWEGHFDPIPPEGTRSVVTPNRERASFVSASRGLELRQEAALPHSHGIYVLALREPYPALYVGLAADDGKAPEGILKRLQKHRVKLVKTMFDDESIVPYSLNTSRSGGPSLQQASVTFDGCEPVVLT